MSCIAWRLKIRENKRVWMYGKLRIHVRDRSPSHWVSNDCEIISPHQLQDHSLRGRLSQLYSVFLQWYSQIDLALRVSRLCRQNLEPRFSQVKCFDSPIEYDSHFDSTAVTDLSHHWRFCVFFGKFAVGTQDYRLLPMSCSGFFCWITVIKQETCSLLLGSSFDFTSKMLWSRITKWDSDLVCASMTNPKEKSGRIDSCISRGIFPLWILLTGRLRVSGSNTEDASFCCRNCFHLRGWHIHP